MDNNLYEILGVNHKSSCNEIRNTYKNLVKKYHPDKGGNVEIFKLITNAYNILTNKTKREEYDTQCILVEQSSRDHNSLRQGQEEYINLEQKKTKEKSRDEVKKEFNSFFDEMDKDNNIEREKIHDSLSTEEINNKIKNLELCRNTDDIENIQENMFENNKFDGKRFNNIFEQYNKPNQELTIHSGTPNAWNNDMNYMTIEENDNKCEGNSVFSNINTQINNNVIKINQDDLQNMNNLTKDEQCLDSNTIEQKIADRNTETQKLNSMGFSDFKTELGEFGIHNNLKITQKQ
jgi:curved DNA-binding protein CbpA